VAKYPNTTAGMKARNEICSADMTKAMKLTVKAKKLAALEALVKNPKYAGTECAMKAQEAWNKLGGGKPAAVPIKAAPKTAPKTAPKK